MDQYIDIFNYIFKESYNKMNKIMENKNVANAIENNSYYQGLLVLYSNLDINIIRAHCFTIIYMLIYHNIYKDL